jgi:formate dehydrogenase alpha subunit
MATFRLDGLEIEFAPGETVLQAARRSGIEIPTLCHDRRLEPMGACRLCVVKVDDRASPQAACSLAAVDGLEVASSDAELDGWRRTILELALSESPDDECPKCRNIAPCELHVWAERYGARPRRFSGAISGSKVEDPNPFILRDYGRCIYCYRCTRVCDEVEGDHAIVAAGRGYETRIATPFDTGLLDSPCTFCGQCVQTCPTGALMDRKMAGRARAEEIERVPTVCPFCGTGCGVELNIARGEIIGVTPDFSSPASAGALCVKGQWGWDFVNSPDRLVKPLIKEDGRLREASWDEALDLVALRLSQIRAEHGADSMAFWSSARGTSEANYLFQKFARAVIGTNNVDNCART